MRKIIFAITIVVLISNYSCALFCKNDKLSLPKQPYNGNELRIDGYYYNIYYEQKIRTYFFYNDGTLLHDGAGHDFDKLDEYEQSINLKTATEKRGKMQLLWGVYAIDGNVIKFERWYPDQPCYPSYVREGIILNDTTFHIIKSYRSNGSEMSTENSVYHFKQFSPKPDSTNSFIK